MSVESIYRWQGGVLEARDYCDMRPRTIERPTPGWSTDGPRSALELHRDRFLDVVSAAGAYAASSTSMRSGMPRSPRIPREGDWFPRVELHVQLDAAALSSGCAPPRAHAARSCSRPTAGATRAPQPRVKGPDLEAMCGCAPRRRQHGADEAVMLESRRLRRRGLDHSAWPGGAARRLCVPAARLAAGRQRHRCAACSPSRRRSASTSCTRR